MRHALYRTALFALALLSLTCQKKDESAFKIPVEYYKLPNGLKVVLSRDATAPTVTVPPTLSRTRTIRRVLPGRMSVTKRFCRA